MNARAYYEHYWSETGYSPRRDRAPDSLRLLFERHVGANDDCLDLGCGDGGTAGVYLAEHSKSYVGVDVSETAIKLAKERGFEAVRINDASVLPFENASFDVVVCSEVLEHLLAPQLAVAEAFRVLRCGGRLIVTVPNAAYWRDRVDALFGIWQPAGDDRGRTEPWRSPHIRFFSPATLRRMLLHVGFDHVEVTGLASPLLGRVPVLRRFNQRPGVVARTAASISPSLLAGGIGAVAVRSMPVTSMGGDEASKRAKQAMDARQPEGNSL
jgi:SAM-dependent methyltransferase